MNTKDLVTNIAGIVIVVAGAVNAYTQSTTGDIQWEQLLMSIATAVVAYFTGKRLNGESCSSKKPVYIKKKKTNVNN